MKGQNTIRRYIENNGLVLIAIVMVLIYWVLDSMASDQLFTRSLIAFFVIVYGIFTQTLINSRKAALEEKEKTQKQLIQAEKLAAAGIVAAGVAHEVKNPLAIIVQGVEYLKVLLESEPVLLDVTERIKKSALRADNIIKGLLSFTRQVPIKAEDKQITPVIEDSLSLVEHLREPKRIQIESKYEANLPLVSIDTNQIRQAFINILSNSIEAMQPEGTINIFVNSIKDETGLNYLQIIFADNGCGIPEGKIEKVFDPFFTTKENTGNTGLGLSVTKGIIDKHRGKIHIESEFGKGTRVVVTMPASNISGEV